jgi:hypothetical protein
MPTCYLNFFFCYFLLWGYCVQMQSAGNNVFEFYFETGSQYRLVLMFA